MKAPRRPGERSGTRRRLSRLGDPDSPAAGAVRSAPPRVPCVAAAAAFSAAAARRQAAAPSGVLLGSAGVFFIRPEARPNPPRGGGGPPVLRSGLPPVGPPCSLVLSAAASLELGVGPLRCFASPNAVLGRGARRLCPQPSLGFPRGRPLRSLGNAAGSRPHTLTLAPGASPGLAAPPRRLPPHPRGLLAATMRAEPQPVGSPSCCGRRAGGTPSPGDGGPPRPRPRGPLGSSSLSTRGSFGPSGR